MLDCKLASKEDQLGLKKIVFFFPGDIQNTRDEMRKNPETLPYVDWCYENVLTILKNRFPESIICLCKPNEYYNGIYACYHSLVKSLDSTGTPRHSFELKAIPTLYRCYQNLQKSREIHENIEHVTLIGFSKGCIVLNQILYELKEAFKSESFTGFLPLLKEFFWLDGGHNGFMGVWLTDLKILNEFKKLSPQAHMIVTPYMMESKSRPWMEKEKSYFATSLIKLGIEVATDSLLFGEAPSSIINHFKVLNYF